MWRGAQRHVGWMHGWIPRLAVRRGRAPGRARLGAWRTGARCLVAASSLPRARRDETRRDETRRSAPLHTTLYFGKTKTYRAAAATSLRQQAIGNRPLATGLEQRQQAFDSGKAFNSVSAPLSPGHPSPGIPRGQGTQRRSVAATAGATPCRASSSRRQSTRWRAAARPGWPCGAAASTGPA